MKKSKTVPEVETSPQRSVSPTPIQDAVPMCWPSNSQRTEQSKPKQWPTYREKLLDQRWQKKRLELLEASGWKCQFSGCTNSKEKPTLHVHHKVYLRGLSPWEYEDWAYSVLCDECHDAAQVQMEKNHCLLAKNQNLRTILFLINQLDDAAQSELLDGLSDILAISVARSGYINVSFFTALSSFAQTAFSKGFGYGENSKS
jgi:hypothetical protein